MVGSIEQVIWFIFLGLLGGVTHILVESKSFPDLIKFEALKTYLIAGIVGFLYNILYSDYNFPNFLMCWVAGYMGTDFIKKLLENFKDKNQT